MKKEIDLVPEEKRHTMVTILRNRFIGFYKVYFSIGKSNKYGYIPFFVNYDEKDQSAKEQAEFIKKNMPRKWGEKKKFYAAALEAANYETAMACGAPFQESCVL